MKACPNCGEILFNVNSSSNEMECLSKICRYSTVSRVGIEIDYFNEHSYFNLLPPSEGNHSNNETNESGTIYLPK